ncbi:DNA-binding transcription factor yap1 [Lunasporangiospora selenospora]|uniref:DNA-binding transcription factor yap1 n=1 Tax=Lunasporangiospora selenospora TaxID=979761 RepID=A0A9P6KB55_9FUNG|nr:DNA-binding transcription factor yap1 [Lunasporangiospora selenospora]
MLQNAGSGTTAQDLLSGPLAGQDYYPPDSELPASPAAIASSKRIISHLHHKSDHYSNAKPGSAIDDNVHFSEGESDDEGDAPSEGKPAPKKAGRKPLTTEPTNKRKAQNRAAQRAFRDRKERYVKSLEDRIKELEDLNPSKSDTKLLEENTNLKVLVQKLETENYILKEQSFTFDFPISQSRSVNSLCTHLSSTSAAALLARSQTSDQVPTSRAMPGTNGFSKYADTNHLSGNNPAVTAAKHLTNDQLPWTPASSGADSVPNSPHDHMLPTPEQDNISHISYTDNAAVVPRYRNGTPEDISLFSTLLDGTGNSFGHSLHSTSSPQHSAAGMSATTTSTATTITTTQAVNHMGFAGTTVPTSAATVTSTVETLANDTSAALATPQSLIDCSLQNQPSPASTIALFTDNSPSPTLDDLVNTPLFSTDKNGNVLFTPPQAPMSLGMTSLTFEQTQALFTDFRDPSDPRDYFASFEDPVETSLPDHSLGGGLFNDPLFDTYALHDVPVVGMAAGQNVMGVTIKVEEVNALPTPAQEVATPIMSTDECDEKTPHRLPPLGENEAAIPCPQVWEHIAKHPKFDDADIDELCAELKSKAKCSGHGPVIALSDVDKLMSRLNQE